MYVFIIRTELISNVIYHMIIRTSLIISGVLFLLSRAHFYYNSITFVNELLLSDSRIVSLKDQLIEYK